MKNSSYWVVVWDRKWKTTWPLKRQEEFLVGRASRAKLACGQNMEVSHLLLWKALSDLQWLRVFKILDLRLIQKMDNNSKEETSEASMTINREDTQDNFQTEEKIGAVGTGQNKHKSPRVDGGHFRLLCELHQELTLPSAWLHKTWQNKTKMLHPQSKKPKGKFGEIEIRSLVSLWGTIKNYLSQMN